MSCVGKSTIVRRVMPYYPNGEKLHPQNILNVLNLMTF